MNDYKNKISRRNFVRLVGATAGAAVVTNSLSSANAASPPDKKIQALTNEGITPPNLKYKTVDSTAEELHKCKPDMKRVRVSDFSFKQVSMDLGVSLFTPLVQSMRNNIKKSYIGPGQKVKTPQDAREHLAVSFALGTWNNELGPYGEGQENKGSLSWNPLNIPEALYNDPIKDLNPEVLAKKVKHISRLVGADRVGICKLNPKWIFESTCRNIYSPDPPIDKPIVFKDIRHPEETEKELIIPSSINRAIVFLVAMPYFSNQLGPSSTQTMGGTGEGYGRMGLVATSIAESIRSLGFNAIPSMNDTALSVPLAIDAGLGQLGRLGYLISPWFGPHIRIAKVFTDMPLATDLPIDFGVTKYCTTCGICAKECPSGAISPDKDRTYEPPAAAKPCGNPGALKWYMNAKKCTRWWIESGAGCTQCMMVCPYTRMNWTNLYDGKPTPEKFWDLKFAPFGYSKVEY